MGVLPAQAASIPEKRLHSEMSYKRLERGQFIWPMSAAGTVSLSPGQLSTLLEGCERRASARNLRPELAG
jgi:transposase